MSNESKENSNMHDHTNAAARLRATERGAECRKAHVEGYTGPICSCGPMECKATREHSENEKFDPAAPAASAWDWPHGPDCRCADNDPRRPLFAGMRCAYRPDWFEGEDPTDRPPPTPMNRYQHDPDGMAAWSRARRRSIFPWVRRRAHHAIQYAIYKREVALEWRQSGLTEWVVR